MTTKLKLVREDGSDARIEDLVDRDGAVIEIDGVPAYLIEYEGPDGLRSPAGSRMRLTLRFQVDLSDHYGVMGQIRTREHCPFARRRAERVERESARTPTPYKPSRNG